MHAPRGVARFAVSGDKPRNNGRVRSVEVSVSILTALARHDGPMSLNEIARTVDMPAAKAHRYLASFLESGMVHHRRSGTYDLGPLAARIGLAAIARTDVVNRVTEELEELVETTNRTALLSVWGNVGPIVVRWERSPHVLITTLGLGSRLPLLRSATGRVFLAFSRRRVTAGMLEAELSTDPSPPDAREIEALIEKTRASGLAGVDQTFIPGLYALAAPVLNGQGEADAVVTLASTEPYTDRTARDLTGFVARHGALEPARGLDPDS